MIVPLLHAVTNSEVLRRPDFLAHAVAVGSVADVAIHLRDRSLTGSELIALAEAITSRCPDAVVLCNDRADVAMASPGVVGVHLPADGLPVTDTRVLLGEEALVGRSTHGAEEARRAIADGANYAFLGPVFATLTHPGTALLGPTSFAGLKGLPVIAIGGITPARVRVCRDAGAWGVAAITAIWDAESPGSAAEAMRVLLD